MKRLSGRNKRSLSLLSSESIARRNRIIREHRTLIHEIRGIEKKVRQMLSDSDSRWRELENDRNAILKKVERTVEEYWSWIPTISLSLCPFCNVELRHPFDPVDLNGFWWMDRTRRPGREPKACEHFNLLLGAVNLNGLSPRGGPFEGRPGPDVPYVIPRILEMPTMLAVISSIAMNCGYTAYPVAYYSQISPAGGSLTQTWAEAEYYFTLEDGKTGWNMVSNSYDYDLLPWLKAGKIRWIEGGRLSSVDDDPEDCPFLDVKGMRRPQVIIEDELSYE